MAHFERCGAFWVRFDLGFELFLQQVGSAVDQEGGLSERRLLSVRTSLSIASRERFSPQRSCTGPLLHGILLNERLILFGNPHGSPIALCPLR